MKCLLYHLTNVPSPLKAPSTSSILTAMEVGSINMEITITRMAKLTNHLPSPVNLTLNRTREMSLSVLSKTNSKNNLVDPKSSKIRSKTNSYRNGVL